MPRFSLTDRDTRVIVDIEDFETLTDALGETTLSPERAQLEDDAQKFLATIQRNTREVHP